MPLDLHYLKEILEESEEKLLKYWHIIAYRLIILNPEEMKEFTHLANEKIKQLVKICSIKIYKPLEPIDMKTGGILFKGSLDSKLNDSLSAEDNGNGKSLLKTGGQQPSKQDIIARTSPRLSKGAPAATIDQPGHSPRYPADHADVKITKVSPQANCELHGLAAFPPEKVKSQGTRRGLQNQGADQSLT